MLKQLQSWLTSYFGSRSGYKYKFVDEIPMNFKDKVIYLECHLGVPWQAVLACPCGCQQKLYLNLVKDYSPCWRFEIKKEKITLLPSVDRKVGCKSHFFIRKGIIDWCEY